MTQNILDSVIVSVVCLFFGPWSDKHGRKPVFFICILGNYVHLEILLFCSIIIVTRGIFSDFLNGWGCKILLYNTDPEKSKIF